MLWDYFVYCNTYDLSELYIRFPKGSGNNMILAFESKSECEQFSQFLKDQQFFDPTVSDIAHIFFPLATVAHLS